MKKTATKTKVYAAVPNPKKHCKYTDKKRINLLLKIDLYLCVILILVLLYKYLSI